MLFRSGDPKRALAPLTKACESVEAEDDDSAFILRSNCFTKLGLYREADQDADAALNLDHTSVRYYLRMKKSARNKTANIKI